MITVKRGGGGSGNPLRKAKCPNFDNKLCIIVRYSTVALQKITYTIGTFVTPWSFAAKERRGRGGVSLTVITVSGPIF